MATPEAVPSIDGAAMAEAATAIAAAKAIVMACHINPDGDALGSLIALGIAINAKYPEKSVTLLSRDGVPEMYRFMPFAERVQASTDRRDFDLAVVLDSGDLKRVGEEIVPVIKSAPVQMDIDHHVGEGSFGRFRLLNSRAAATAEIVFDLIEALGVEVTPDIAGCLLTGIITDTGSFRFMNVTPRTLRIAAMLIEAGASPALISEQVFDNRAFDSTKLMGAVLARLSHTDDGRITWASVSRAVFAETGTTDEDTEGLINFVRAVRGTEIALLFREIKPGVVRISLRCSQKHDVSLIANQFGGGGHKMASGCSFHGALADAQEALVAACKTALAADRD
jgi:bifunctional oligoribonuclease and PAP phosphatase NrnA